MISSQGTKLVALQSSLVVRSITRTTSHVVSLDLSYNNLADLSPELLAAAAQKVKGQPESNILGQGRGSPTEQDCARIYLPDRSDLRGEKL